jgi:predicted nucleic acid-binding Zn ribbon protein
MDGSEQRTSSLTRPRRPKSKEVAKLGDVLTRLLEERLSPRQARFELISRLWEELLPAEICHHCKIVDISGGELKVLVDSPSYANELRWCSSQLLMEFERRCPRARVRRITFTLG